MSEIRSDGGTATSWTKTNHDPAGNPTDRCVWNAAPSEACKAVGTAMSPEPAVRTTTAYDARNGRTSLKVPGRGETTYDPAKGYLVDKVYTPLKLSGSNQVIAEHVADHTYDERLRLEAIDQSFCAVNADTHTCSGAATTTASVDYVYDDNDNRTEVAESSTGGTPTTMTYCYDALDRLTAAKATTSCTSSPTETYTYDDAGNRETATGTTFAYDAQGQLSSCSPSCGTIAYDDAGRTSRWDGWYLSYDGEGRLASACAVSGCATGDHATMRYDGEGRRSELVRRRSGTTTTTTFRYQGDAIAQELTGGSVTRTFVTDEAGRVVKFCDPDCAGSNPQYLVTWNGHGDAVGIWLINSDGTLTRKQSMTYDTWGTPTVRDGSGTVLAWDDAGSLKFRYLYVGAFGVAWDELGLGLEAHHMGVRHYSPALGRFLQPDPSAQETNLYAYAENGPISKVDPGGELASDLNDREKAYCAQPWHWYNCFLAGELRAWAWRETRQRWPRPSGGGVNPSWTGGKADAFRHCCWSAALTHRLGWSTAWRITDWNHEYGDKKQKGPSRSMDLHNNAVGRQIGRDIPEIYGQFWTRKYAKELDLIATRCDRALLFGRLRYLHK